MTRNIILIVDASLGAVADFSPEEFFVLRTQAAARGLTAGQHVKDISTNYALRRKGIIVDFAPLVNETPASAL